MTQPENSPLRQIEQDFILTAGGLGRAAFGEICRLANALGKAFESPISFQRIDTNQFHITGAPSAIAPEMFSALNYPKAIPAGTSEAANEMSDGPVIVPKLHFAPGRNPGEVQCTISQSNASSFMERHELAIDIKALDFSVLADSDYPSVITEEMSLDHCQNLLTACPLFVVQESTKALLGQETTYDTLLEISQRILTEIGEPSWHAFRHFIEALVVEFPTPQLLSVYVENAPWDYEEEPAFHILDHTKTILDEVQESIVAFLPTDDYTEHFAAHTSIDEPGLIMRYDDTGGWLVYWKTITGSE